MNLINVPTTYAFHSRASFHIALFGFATEMSLLLLFRGSVFEYGGFVFLLIMFWIFWFWLSLSWILGTAVSGFRCVIRDRTVMQRTGAVIILVVIASPTLFSYLASWGYYLRAGRFANVESFRFLFRNFRMFRLYLQQAEYDFFISLFMISVLALGVIAYSVIRIARSPGSSPEGLNITSAKRCFWYLSTILWMLPFLIVVQDGSRVRRETRVHFLLHEVNPLVVFASSWVETLGDEKTGSCLVPSQLVPIAYEDRKIVHDPSHPPPSIVFIAVESLRHDVVHLRHQGREVMPNLNKLARKGLHWTRAYSPSTHSDYSDVSILSSLYPLRARHHHYYSKTDPWPKTLIYDLLKPLGYATAIISSQNEGWGRMDQFLETTGLDLLLDSARSLEYSRFSDRDVGLALEIRTGALKAGKLDDSVTTEYAIAWISEQVRQGKPFFLSLNFQNAHFPYELSSVTPRPFNPGTIDFSASFLGYPQDKKGIVQNAYYNALFETDRQIGRLLGVLEQNKILDETMVIVYGDNGEAFHEKGLVTHAQDPIEPVIRVACIFHSPRFFPSRKEEYPFSLVDIVPTVLGRIGLPAHPNFQGIDCLGVDLPPKEERLLFIHNENALSRADSVILGGRWKYILDRRTREEFLYDLLEDPSEGESVLYRYPWIAEKLRYVYKTWRCRQLSYYQNPALYRQYYPPRLPGWE